MKNAIIFILIIIFVLGLFFIITSSDGLINNNYFSVNLIGTILSIFASINITIFLFYYFRDNK